MRREWLRVSLLTAVFGVALAACSNGDDAATSTTVATPTSTASSVPATSTTTSTTTTAPSSTTTSTTTAPTTTAAPPSTVTTTLPDGVPPRVTFLDDPEKQAVVDAAYAFFDALRSAQRAPDSQSLRQELDATMTDPIAGRVNEFLDGLSSEGEVVLPNAEQPTFVDIWSFTVVTFDGGSTFDACVVDADVRVRLGSGGTEVVIDDSISSAAQTYELRMVDGDWRVGDIDRFGEWEGPVGCG